MKKKLSTILLPLFVPSALLVMACPYVTFEADDGGSGDTEKNDDDSIPGTESTKTSFSGIDLLLVVDNSYSMEEEQQILSTSILNLVNIVLNPIEPWPVGTPDEVRIAIASSDLGLQYGPEKSIEDFPYEDMIPSCTEAGAERGDDGVFQTLKETSVLIENGQVECVPGGKQCPSGWTCGDGTCESPSGNAELVSCTEKKWVSTTNQVDLHIRVTCMAKLGTSGCGVEQQLETAVRGLTRDAEQRAFIDDDHLLVVLIVSDEEDCSIADKGLFETPEWISGTRFDQNDPTKGLLNTACNLPVSNEDFLFEPDRYYDELVKIKDNNPNAVVFGAIVGVPTHEDAAGDSPCQGQGNNLGQCLDHASMEIRSEVFQTENGAPYIHFRPACERQDGDTIVTSARPGRRYVEVAESFGENGYVYSICNHDWNPAMTDLAQIIGKKIKQ